jgi:hypothetical protein
LSTDERSKRLTEDCARSEFLIAAGRRPHSLLMGDLITP